MPGLQIGAPDRNAMISPMQILRNSKRMAALVLAWWALFLGASMAAAAMKSGELHGVCSPGGVMKWVDTSGAEGEVKLGGGILCPLCASVSAPPPAAFAAFEKPFPGAQALQALAAAHIAPSTAPPLPSRGPPSLS
jgi:hypothetical protein